ncbi:MAG TPA: dCTP deaminase [Candidatus Thermoplasmatota archaeon]|nr:dCTP deaminase [Candidatus Thermoplasmatota archaeon]
MILSDRDIRERLARGDLVVDPLDDPDVQVQPASVDLRLGSEFLAFRNPHIPYLDTRGGSVEAYTERIVIPEGGMFILHPGEFVLGTTLERVRIPDDLVAKVEGRSSLGRLAVVVHATAGFVDPGFEGHITLELSNLGRVPVALHPGMRVSQIALHQMASPAERPYGHPTRNSKYQGQRGPVASRISRESPRE